MEAADLGARLCQDSFRAVYMCYLMVAVPVVALCLASYELVDWLPGLALWWLKPWLDRTVLFVLARALAEAWPGDAARDELVARAEGTDACLTPVLSPTEAASHPHNAARGTFVEIGGMVQPAPAPRFDRTPPSTPEAPRAKGSDTEAVLAELGVTDLDALRAAGVIA